MLHAGYHRRVGYVVGPVAGCWLAEIFPELDSLHGDEYRRSGAMDCQLLGIMDIPNAG